MNPPSNWAPTDVVLLAICGLLAWLVATDIIDRVYASHKALRARKHQANERARNAEVHAQNLRLLEDVATLQRDVRALQVQAHRKYPPPSHRMPALGATTTAKDPKPLRERMQAGDPALAWTPDQPIHFAKRTNGNGRHHG